MEIIFLSQSRDDIRWFSSYYLTVFPEGASNGYEQMDAALQMLKGNPYVGKPTDEIDVREVQVTRTPFSLIYRVTKLNIEIIRVWDNRGDRPRRWMSAAAEGN